MDGIGKEGGEMRTIVCKRFFMVLLNVLLLLALYPIQTHAMETDEDLNRYYLGTDSLVNAGKDTGYSKKDAITEKDSHFGWRLGSFYVSGYTRVVDDNTENPVFLKTVGDKVTLWFSLEQDINCLNGKENLSIHEDKNGYDQYFEVEKTNFGRGTLIIRYTDYQNKIAEPTIYTDYLVANVSSDADTKEEMFEEGDYEVSLLYEVKDDPRKILGLSVLPTYTNYRVSFRFSVRNGNCMVFPFDVETGEELTNAAITEGGFYLDFAKSRYLDIDIKKEVLRDSAEGLTQDVRFNRPAKDGDKYTDEGIYTITASNRYTNETTTKVIYVGTNDILKAHVVTGLSINEIENQLAMGASVATDGTIIPPTMIFSNLEEMEATETMGDDSPEKLEEKTEENDIEIEPDITRNMLIFVIVSGIIVVVIVGIIVGVRIHKKKSKAKNTLKEGDDN